MYKIAVGLSQILLLVAFSGFAHRAAAQTASNASAIASINDPRLEPFEVGETLVYEGKINRLPFPFAVDIATLNFTVVKPESNPSQTNRIFLKAEAISKGSLLKLFRLSFLQRAESTVDANNFRALHTLRRDEQNKRIRDGEAKFDYAAKKVVYREVDPTNPASPPRMITSRLEAPAQDLLSAIYFLRRQTFAVGKSFEIPVSDSGVVYRVPVKVTARERLKTVLGKVWAWRVEPEVFGEKRMIQDEGKMVIWLTDDLRRLPVRSLIQTSFGKIEVKLRSAEGLRAAK